MRFYLLTQQITGLFLGYGFDTRYYGELIANSRIANISKIHKFKIHQWPPSSPMCDQLLRRICPILCVICDTTPSTIHQGSEALLFMAIYLSRNDLQAKIVNLSLILVHVES